MARRKAADIARDFENDVLDFVKNIGFRDCYGGPSFKIGGKQVDVGCGEGDTYIIIDCTTATENGKEKSLRNKIEAWRGNFDIFKEGLKSNEQLQDYNYKEVRLVIATRGIKLNDSDIDIAQQNPKVYIWDDQFFEYYKELKEKIGKFAKYELIRELDISVNSKLEGLPAIKPKTLTNEEYYLTSVNPIKLLEISYVARRERGDQKFYQRMIKDEKLNKIAYFIQHDGKQFYNNVIVSIDDNKSINFKPIQDLGEEQIGLLNINTDNGSVWIIDGQHRLYGYAKLIEKHKDVELDKIKNSWRIPITIIVGIDREQQGKIFMDINTTQTSLPADYIWDLYSIYEKDNREGFISQVVKELNANGFLKDKIYIPSYSVNKAKGKLQISKIGRAIKDSGIFAKEISDKNNRTKSIKKCADYINNELYYSYTKSEKWAKFFTSNAGIQVLMPLLKEFSSNNLEQEANQYIDILLDFLNRDPGYKDAEINQLSKEISNKTSKEEFIETLKEGINKEIDARGLQDKLSKLKAKEKGTIFSSLEKMLREFIYKQMSEIDSDWLKHRLSDESYKQLYKQAITKTPEGIWEKAGIGECKEVINRKDNWKDLFEKIFISDAYPSKEELINDLEKINKYGKRQTSHGTGDPHGYDRKVAEYLALKLKKFLEEKSKTI